MAEAEFDPAYMRYDSYTYGSATASPSPREVATRVLWWHVRDLAQRCAETEAGRTHLPAPFDDAYDPAEETWNGERTYLELAVKELLVNVEPIEERFQEIERVGSVSYYGGMFLDVPLQVSLRFRVDDQDVSEMRGDALHFAVLRSDLERFDAAVVRERGRLLSMQRREIRITRHSATSTIVPDVPTLVDALRVYRNGTNTDLAVVTDAAYETGAVEVLVMTLPDGTEQCIEGRRFSMFEIARARAQLDQLDRAQPEMDQRDAGTH